MTKLSDIALKTLEGAPMTLGDHAGEVLLLVNVASKCGFTPQYEGLQSLYDTLKDRGFSVIGFPANDFGAQEPGTEAEIATFCSTTYGVSFPISQKITVTGPDKHPLYDALIHAQPKTSGDTEGFRAKLRGYGMEPNPEPELLWNFEKFVVGRDGSVVARFPSSTTPDDAALRAVIESELAK
jgi:glutathione peroxidase